MKLNKVILLTAFLILFSTFANAETINIEKLNYDLGMQSLQQNNLHEAVKYFNLVIDKTPQNVEAHYNLAITYKKLGLHTDALRHFDIVVLLLNSPPEEESELVKISRLKQKNTEDFDVYKQVKEKENNYIDLGDMHADNDQHETAIEYYNLALKINPYNDNTYFKVCKSYIALGNYNMAEPYIRRALELDTENPRYKYFQTVVMDKSDTKSTIALQNLNDIDPLKDFEDSYYNKDLYKENIPQKEKEKSLISEYYEDEDKKEILDKLSRQEYKDFSYKQSQELDYLDLGDLHFDNREFETAAEYYKMALGINSSNDYTYYKLSRCYIELGRFEEADNYIEKAMALSGKNRKYTYFKNQIDDKIAGRPFSEAPSSIKGGTSENDFYVDEIAGEPYREDPEFFSNRPSFWKRTKNAVTSFRFPDLSNISFKMPDFRMPDMPNMPDIKMPKLEGKIETAQRTETDKDDIFNQDLERYKISEKFRQEPQQEIGAPEQPKTSSYADEFYNDKGIEFFKADNLEKAEVYFKKAVQLRPMDPRGYNNLANVEYKRGNLLKAKEYALKSVETDPNFAQGYYNLSRISKKENDFEREIYYLNRAIAANPKYYQTYFARGLAYYSRGNSEKAKYNFTEVLSLRNDHYLASQNLGIIYANELNYKQAEKYLQQAVRLNKNNSQSYFYLGYVQQNSGKIAGSIENLREALRLNPTNYRAYIELSRSYMANNEPDRALQTLKNAAEKAPENAEIYNYLGLMSLKFSQYEDACLAFQKAVRKNAERPLYHYNLSQCYLCLGKRKESNLAFQKAVSIIPVTVQDYIDLAEIFFDRGMTSYSIETIKSGISQLPNDDYLYLVLSDFYQRTGATNIAQEVLEKYLKKVNSENTFTLLVRKRLSELQSGI